MTMYYSKDFLGCYLELANECNTISYHLWSFTCKYSLEIVRIVSCALQVYCYGLFRLVTCGSATNFRSRIHNVPKKEASVELRRQLARKDLRI